MCRDPLTNLFICPSQFHVTKPRPRPSHEEKYPSHSHRTETQPRGSSHSPDAGFLETDLSYYTGESAEERDEDHMAWGWNYNKHTDPYARENSNSRKSQRDSRKKKNKKKRKRNKSGGRSNQELQPMSPSTDNFVSKDASPEVKSVSFYNSESLNTLSLSHIPVTTTLQGLEKGILVESHAITESLKTIHHMQSHRVLRQFR